MFLKMMSSSTNKTVFVVSLFNSVLPLPSPYYMLSIFAGLQENTHTVENYKPYV
jgi:hypothetical protein